MMKLLTLALFFSVASCRPIPSTATFEEGLAVVQKGDFTSAMNIWMPLAQAGNADAEFNVGYLYANGLGVKQDYTQAKAWYEKAAKQNNTPCTSSKHLN